MKIALAHDYLNQWGGAERVLEVLAEIFPKAPIFTLMHDREKTFGRFDSNAATLNIVTSEDDKAVGSSTWRLPKSRNGGHQYLEPWPSEVGSAALKSCDDRKIKASFLDFKYARKNHRKFIPLMPLAARMLKIPNDYDLVISSSAGFAKGFMMSPRTRHISYIHTPLRYAWEQNEYISDMRHAAWIKTFGKPILNYLKKWDYNAGQKPDLLLANSEFIAGKIKKYYGRDAKVVYPPVDLSVFYHIPHTLNPKHYFLAIGRFLHYKKFDLAIEAFKELGLPLKIVGAGPEENKIKNQISKIKNIETLPFVKDQNELRELYQNARAVIFPQVEDFGLVAAESIACGTPVIAYNGGGAAEIVNEKSGVLFRDQTTAGLINAVKDFIKKERQFTPAKVAIEAKRFSKENFIREITRVLE